MGLVGEPVEVNGLLETFITERPLPDNPASFEDGYKKQRVLDAIERSARDGKWVKIG